jgi:vacuolar-type H+-ATPase subunit I/STV1
VTWKQTLSLLVCDHLFFFRSYLQPIIKLDSDGGDQLTVVVASLIAVFLVSSVITFIVGFICGQRFGRKFMEPPNQASGRAHPPRGLPVPIYESIVPDTTHEEQAIELEENVAYGPAPST